jgi:hypothetical protein
MSGQGFGVDLAAKGRGETECKTSLNIIPHHTELSARKEWERSVWEEHKDERHTFFRHCSTL